MLDQDFCDLVEIKLTNALSSNDKVEIEGFWCDGVLLPDSSNDISKKSINDKRKTVLKAFIGKNGQDKYELILKFGSKSLSKYARDLNLEDCFPNKSFNDWIEIDIVEKVIIMQLL